MAQTGIPYLFMRGGTSRGPYFERSDLPEDEATLSEVLIHAVGAGHRYTIDGIGGGTAITTKVAMLSRSDDDRADVDYFFAQVAVEERAVDYRPTCGNILAGVGPAALEMGLVAVSGAETRVRIRAVNTGARIESVVQTPGGVPLYEGAAEIAGVPGSAAPVTLKFSEVAGSVTGTMLPTRAAREVIDGIEVTCLDVAMPVVLARAADFGLTGYEDAADLDANREFYGRMEPIRRIAGERMGMGDVSGSVTPKFAVLAPPRAGGAVTARYFMPRACHPGMAVTGAQCIATACVMPGTVADGIALAPAGSPATLTVEHPTGGIDVLLEYEAGADFAVKTAGLVRTARLLARGEVFVPGAVWAGKGR